ncbi:MAG: hypothetical protein P1U86_16255 [Verrucomicrobiales bacterium]|nr:hypothetical protein [Verrucomicrobiales bacterium]
MEDIPWLPLAMVFIAFLSWLRNRIVEAAEIRRARNAAKAEVARARRTTEPAKPAYESPYRDARSPEVVEEEIPRTFKELLDEINAQRTAPAAPPPLPPQVPKVEEVFDEADEPWGDGDEFGGIAAVPELPKVTPILRKKAVRKGRHPLAKTLSDGNQLRTALILKEILGPPKALSRNPRR